MFNKAAKNRKNFALLICWLLICLPDSPVFANPKIAVLDFELRDLTMLPGIPEEIDRTASVKPMLEEELTKAGFEIVYIPHESQIKATFRFRLPIRSS